MRATPEVPRWIRDFRYPGYTNVFSILPACTRLYGTETLFGDWDAPVLLLAKDAAPAKAIERLALIDPENAWRHARRDLGDKKGVRTNERLVQLASSLPGSKLYGSALANLMLDDDSWSRRLPEFRKGELNAYLQLVLAWVIESMPKLKAIACLGNESWYLTCQVLGKDNEKNLPSKYRGNEPLAAQYRGRTIWMSSLYHPAAHITVLEMEKGWDSLRMKLA